MLMQLCQWGMPFGEEEVQIKGMFEPSPWRCIGAGTWIGLSPQWGNFQVKKVLGEGSSPFFVLLAQSKIATPCNCFEENIEVLPVGTLPLEQALHVCVVCPNSVSIWIKIPFKVVANGSSFTLSLVFQRHLCSLKGNAVGCFIQARGSFIISGQYLRMQALCAMIFSTPEQQRVIPCWG